MEGYPEGKYDKGRLVLHLQMFSQGQKGYLVCRYAKKIINALLKIFSLNSTIVRDYIQAIIKKSTQTYMYIYIHMCKVTNTTIRHCTR